MGTSQSVVNVTIEKKIKQERTSLIAMRSYLQVGHVRCLVVF